jgi:hypothetical protein
VPLVSEPELPAFHGMIQHIYVPCTSAPALHKHVDEVRQSGTSPLPKVPRAGLLNWDCGFLMDRLVVDRKAALIFIVPHQVGTLKSEK